MVTKGGLLAVLLLSALMAAPGPARSAGARSTGYEDPAQEPAANQLATSPRVKSADPSERITPRFQVGEKLVFEVKFKSFPVYATVGEITMEYLGPQTDPQIQGFDPQQRPPSAEPPTHLRGRAISKGLVTSLLGIEINNRYETLVDSNDFSALVSLEEVQESKRHLIATSIFDREHQKIAFTQTDASLGGRLLQSKILAWREGVLDILSCFYFIRLQKMKAGQTLNLPVNRNGEMFVFQIAIEKQEKISTEQGKVRAWRLKPNVFGPGQMFARQGQMWVWLCDGEAHIPLRLLAKTSGSTIVANLTQSDRPCPKVGKGQ
jgi:Protein of unknown function (DUF3108)